MTADSKGQVPDFSITIDRPRRTKILVLRPDRIGDVVLSTPVLEAIKHYFPDTEVHLLVRDAVFPVVEHNPFISKIITYRPDSVHQGFSGFWRLVREIRNEKYDVAITLQSSWKVSFALFLSGVRHRVGPFSKWYSFFIFNRGIRQKRSAVEMHETDYNLMLLRKLGIRVLSRQFEPRIVVKAEAKDRMREYVRNLGIGDDEKFVIIHPGMGGSALNWPEGYYIDLAQRLAAKGIAVIVTGATLEKSLVERVIRNVFEMGGSPRIFPFIGANSAGGLSDMIALLSLAKVVVAPSTGPLHMAAALGKATVSFYPPIKVQSALRWGPYVNEANEQKHEVLVPDALCGRDFKCAGKKCYFYLCMERLSVEEAFRSVVNKFNAF